jgi:hypothetical protein
MVFKSKAKPVISYIISLRILLNNQNKRPFSLAAEDISDLWNSGHQCIHARPEADIMLDYLKQFLCKRTYFAN